MNFSDYQQQRCQRIEKKLQVYLPKVSSTPSQLHQAMAYAVQNGGKYIRPLLVYATGESLGAKVDALDAPAVAVELIHAYSLIHDDLPAMDNADLRRGKPSCHKAFGDALAILAGDALLPLAFEIIGQADFQEDKTKLTMLITLAKAAGAKGMVGGQVMDLEGENKTLDLETLIQLHHKKTGALIQASVKLGALTVSQQDKSHYDLLENFSQKLGLAYQIQDDILDVESSTELLGKTAGIDEKLNKTTFPQLLGMEQAKKKANELFNEALLLLNELPFKQNYLADLTKRIIERLY